MKIQERIYKRCRTCNHVDGVERDDVYGCDQCKAALDMNKPGREYLDVTRFTHGNEATHHEFCSWKCLVKWVKKNKSNHFISLPYLSFDTKYGKKFAQEFFKMMRAT